MARTSPADLEAAAACVDLADAVVARATAALAGGRRHRRQPGGRLRPGPRRGRGRHRPRRPRLRRPRRPRGRHGLRLRRRRAGRPRRQAGRAGRPTGGPDPGPWPRPPASWPLTGAPAPWPTSACEAGPRHLDDDFELVRETFHRFAEEKVRPHAEHVHRTNGDIPEEIIAGLAELGGFGLSVPEEYGGFATGGESDYLGMVVATEELSWGSLGIGGSLITRPEILTRALVHGGTEEQKRTWLPRLATAEVLAAVAVTEPDYGSDVANIVTAATPTDGGWLVNGVKTWCTFAARADVLMLLARTDPDRSLAHRGLSMFVVDKPRGDGRGFVHQRRPERRRLEGRPIDTLGYRGMHSYEVAFEDWFVPDANLVGGASGLGRGFYLQMQGFENGRLQTAARAVGVMQAAYEAAYDYAANRRVFGSPIVDYQLTRAKLARMAVVIQATRQFSYDVARRMARGEGALEASMVKAYVCRAAEWVTREAMQIHGGHGLRRGVPGEPLLRRRPGAVDLRGGRRDAGPQGHRPAAARAGGLTGRPIPPSG